MHSINIQINRDLQKTSTQTIIPADGDDEKKINEARRKAFTRGENQALDCHLIQTYQVAQQQLVWFINDERAKPFMVRPDCGTGGTQGL